MKSVFMVIMIQLLMVKICDAKAKVTCNTLAPGVSAMAIAVICWDDDADGCQNDDDGCLLHLSCNNYDDFQFTGQNQKSEKLDFSTTNQSIKR